MGLYSRESTMYPAGSWQEPEGCGCGCPECGRESASRVNPSNRVSLCPVEQEGPVQVSPLEDRNGCALGQSRLLRLFHNGLGLCCSQFLQQSRLTCQLPPRSEAHRPQSALLFPRQGGEGEHIPSLLAGHCPNTAPKGQLLLCDLL